MLGQRSAVASDNWVYLDYIDVWDGTTMPDGVVEQDDARVWRSTNWTPSTNSAASGGTYLRDGSNVWFPFTGDTVTLQGFADTNAGQVRILIDGVSRGVFDLKSASATVRTFAFDQLGTGPHVVQLQNYRGGARIDVFQTPGSAPFVTPVVRSGVVRYEEDDPALRFNDVPFGVTAGAWNVGGVSWASSGYAASAKIADSTASLTFTGTWASVGLITRANGGQAEILIDGVSQGVVDTYSRYDTVTSRVYANLGSGSHTPTVRVLGQRHAFASDNWVYLDYIDVWDGTTMPDGTVEQDDARVWRSTNWTPTSNAAASGGTYLRDGSNVWFPFTGDTVTVQGFADTNAGQVRILIDGVSRGVFDLKNASATVRTFAFDQLGAGPHVVQLQNYRGGARIDAFQTPGSAPFVTPAARSGVVRYEEDDPALRFTGEPLSSAPSAWNVGGNGRLSGDYGIWAKTAGSTASLDFTGSWVHLGFLTKANAGKAEITIDGVSQGVIDTYSSADQVASYAYANLGSGAHTLTLTVLGQHSTGASDNWVYLDYIDVWDGTTMPDGTFEQDDARVIRTANWVQEANSVARGGSFMRSGSNVWFPFTGDSVTVQSVALSSAGQITILVDGVRQGTFDIGNTTPVTRSWTFGPLTPGAHVVQVQPFSGQTRVDAFRASGSGTSARTTTPRSRVAGVAAPAVARVDAAAQPASVVQAWGNVAPAPLPQTGVQTRTITYDYDGLNRLTSAVEAGMSSNVYGYGYDLAGNRTDVTTNGTTTSQSYNAANQVIGWTYDAAGNLLSDGTTTYSYDALNRALTTRGITNTYNADGVLVQQGTTRYTQDLASPLSQILGDGTSTYVYGQERLFAQASGARLWYTADALGSVRQTLDDSGTVLGSVAYDPWGQVQQGRIPTFGFTGELQQGNDVYLRARWYNAANGSFTTQDPLGEAGGLNKYVYTSNDPVNRADAPGLKDYYIGSSNPTIVFDAGSGPWGSKPATRTMQALKAAILAKPVSLSVPHALAHLKHYLGNTGTDYYIDLLEMVHQVEDAKQWRDIEINRAKEFAQTLEPGKYNITSRSVNAWPDGPYNLKEQNWDWFYAVGGYSSWGKATVSVECTTSEAYTYIMDFEYHVLDRYNWDWDVGKGVGILGLPVPDEFMAQFHLQGLAKEFTMKGTIHKRFIWFAKPGESFDPTIPDATSGYPRDWSNAQ